MSDILNPSTDPFADSLADQGADDPDTIVLDAVLILGENGAAGEAPFPWSVELAVDIVPEGDAETPE